MKVIATHVTDQGTMLRVADRMRRGQPGLLMLPPHATLGGCLWGLVQQIEAVGQHLISDFASGLPHIGRAHDSPHTIWIEVDVPGNYENFNPDSLARIQAECLLGVPPFGAPAPNHTVSSELKFQVTADRMATMTPVQLGNFNALWAGGAGNLPALTTSLAQWLRMPGRATGNLPAVVHPDLGLTGGSRNRVFGVGNLRSAEHCLWEAVGQRCCQVNRVGLVSVPRGCYVTRTGGGRFVVVPNTLVPARIRLRPRTVPWL